MRILVFHGYLLGGTGSNVYNARLAAAFVLAVVCAAVLARAPIHAQGKPAGNQWQFNDEDEIDLFGYAVLANVRSALETMAVVS